MLVTRVVYKLEDYVTLEHNLLMNKIITLTGSVVGIAYITEFFIAAYSGVEYEQYAFINRMAGPLWWSYAAMMTCNVLSPQLFWFQKIRENIFCSFVMALIVNICMWF